MMSNERPTPEQMLARVKSESSVAESSYRTGRLKLFFGYAAGVGKTFAMLQAAQMQKQLGRDVVLGYVEPHARPETQALTEGLESIPRLEIPYRGTNILEFDLDAALARKPELILVDELAHSNLPSMRHVKRWQDVEELLSAGIDVYSTINVQHVESLNSVISEISGVQVRETVPDDIFERADEIALVDIPPDELLERLKQGKIYVPTQAAFALNQFFRRNNLVALREMALRHTADRVHEDVEIARLGSASNRPWPTNERLLVCIGPSPTSAKVVRAAKRLADRLHSPWLALHIETPNSARLSIESRQNLHRNLKLAESLGAEVVQISGEEVSQELLLYASSRNVTKIVVGKTGERIQWWRFRKTLVDRMVENSGNIDVIVVRGIEDPSDAKPLFSISRKRLEIRPWFETIGAMGIATILALVMERFGFSEANLIMVYLLAVVAIAGRAGAIQSTIASLLAVLLFDVLFTRPYYSVTVNDSQYLVTFAVMLTVGVTASTLTSRVRYQAEVARKNERQTEALYRLSRRLASTTRIHDLVHETEQIVSEVFDAHAVIYLPDEQQKLRPVLEFGASFAASAKEFAVAQWVLDHNEPAGAGTNTLPSSESLFIPLATPERVVGVMAVQSNSPEIELSLEARQLLDTYATQIAFALERYELSERSRGAEVEIESEKLRSSLLAAVSHDLRTPLAAIAGAASSLYENQEGFSSSSRQTLLSTIVEESKQLTRLVENLLHMTRLSSGKVHINRQWQPLEEVIGSALHRLERILVGREIKIEIAGEMLLVHADEILLETVLVNLLENAVRYSENGTPIEIQGKEMNGGIAVEVADRGRGLLPGDEQRIFEMFHRGSGKTTDRRGTGLGLAICAAIIRVHQGSIEAENREGGGTIFRFTIPSQCDPPKIAVDEGRNE